MGVGSNPTPLTKIRVLNQDSVSWVLATVLPLSGLEEREKMKEREDRQRERGSR